MKIAVNSDRKYNNATGYLIAELKKRDMYIEGTDADIVFNIDSIHNVGFIKGKKLTLYWEVDDFMSFGRNTNYYEQADILYIVHPEYSLFYPPRVKVLRAAADPDFHKEDPTVKKEFDYIFVGSVEPLPVYYERLYYFDRCLKTGANMVITFGKQKEYAKQMSRGKVILDVLPKLPNNGNVCVHLRLYEAMATGCLMVDYHPFLDKLFTKGVHYLTYDRFGKVTNEEIEKVKKASRELIISKHTWKHRVDQVLTDIYDRIGK